MTFCRPPAVKIIHVWLYYCTIQGDSPLAFKVSCQWVFVAKSLRKMVSLSKDRPIISYIFKAKAYAKIFSKFKNTQGSDISIMTFNVHPHIQYYFMCLFFIFWIIHTVYRFRQTMWKKGRLAKQRGKVQQKENRDKPRCYCDNVVHKFAEFESILNSRDDGWRR